MPALRSRPEEASGTSGISFSVGIGWTNAKKRALGLVLEQTAANNFRRIGAIRETTTGTVETTREDVEFQIVKIVSGKLDGLNPLIGYGAFAIAVKEYATVDMHSWQTLTYDSFYLHALYDERSTNLS